MAWHRMSYTSKNRRKSEAGIFELFRKSGYGRRGDGIMLKLLNLLMFVACMIVAVLHFQHGNMCTATGMASLGIVNLLLGVR